MDKTEPSHAERVLLEGLRVILAKARAMNPDFHYQDWFDNSSIVVADEPKEPSQEP
jgi:hypothetical protein